MKIEVTGVSQTIKYVKDKLNNVKKQEQKGLTKAAIFIQGEVKASIAGQRAEKTSVDTGRFINSVDFVTGTDDAKIFTGIPYSKFLEYGTTRIRARPHFRNTKSRNQAKAVEIINAEIKKI